MPTLLDLIYLALFAVALPLVDYFVFLPRLQRRLQADPARARRRLYAEGIAVPWMLTAVGAALWSHHERSWSALGFTVPTGWRLWLSLGLVLLLAAYTAQAVAALIRDADARASLRAQFGTLASILPHTRTEFHWFGGVSLTAGFCEEFLFRGYLIWVLAAWLGWWGAAAVSLLLFAGAHAYQGWNGVIRVAIVGAVYTLIVAMTQSLWPAIVLHALLDLGQGAFAWLVLRDAEAADTAS